MEFFDKLFGHRDLPRQGIIVRTKDYDLDGYEIDMTESGDLDFGVSDNDIHIVCESQDHSKAVNLEHWNGLSDEARKALSEAGFYPQDK